MDKTKLGDMELNKNDIGIVIKEDGSSQIYVPKKEDISWQSIDAMLKQIRELEVIWTEISNDTYEDTEK